jgi:benzaldehyde dehydrogenase (NAD)
VFSSPFMVTKGEEDVHHEACPAADARRHLDRGDTTVHDEPQMPFGGVKAGGWGRFGGRAALEAFTEVRWITVQSPARAYPI